MKNVAVEGATVTFYGPGLTSYGAVTISGSYSDNVVIDGKKAFADKITGTCASMTFENYVSGPVEFEIKGSSGYVICDEKNVILYGDASGNISVPATYEGDTPTFSVTANVIDAGQTNVKAE